MVAGMNNFIDKFNSYPLAQKILGLVGLMVLLFVAFWMLVFDPMRHDITQANNDIVAMEDELQKLQAMRLTRTQVLGRLENMKQQLLIAREKLPEGAEIPSLLQRIHNQAKTAGLEINKFKREPDVTQDYYVEIPVNMELVGTYDELANFIYYVGRMTRIVNIKDLELARKAKEGLSPSGELVVTAMATTFSYKKE